MLNTNTLYYVPSKGVFLKIQSGTGDNLDKEAIAQHKNDYVLWNTFKPSSLGIDGELEMTQVDSGMVYFARCPYTNESTAVVLADVLAEAFGENNLCAVGPLFEDND